MESPGLAASRLRCGLDFARNDGGRERRLPGLFLSDARQRCHRRTPDWSKVFAEAARLNKAVEIDGDPNRQDLRVSLLKLARKEGCRISLGTDAHHPEEFAYMELALAAACVAKIPAKRIVSFLPLAELTEWVASVRA